MGWSVYADLSRPLTPEERQAIAASLDALWPGGGSVGPNRGGGEEVYFVVEVLPLAGAEEAAARLLDAVLAESGVRVRYTLQLQRRPHAS
jgi:hypothetical protein